MNNDATPANVGSMEWLGMAEQLRKCADDDNDCLPQMTVRAVVMRAAAAEIERLHAMLNFIGMADGGGELFPVGPSDTEYAADGNTVVRNVGPWRFLHGKGETFIDAVEDAMKDA